MDYTFSVERKASYLHVRVGGENTGENVRRYLRDILAACAAHACARVLIEEHLVGGSLSTLEMFSIVSQGSAAAATVGPIAYVDTNPEHDRQLLRFAESVALNRGMQMKVFATVREAAVWLDSVPSPAVTS